MKTRLFFCLVGFLIASVLYNAGAAPSAHLFKPVIYNVYCSWSPFGKMGNIYNDNPGRKNLRTPVTTPLYNEHNLFGDNAKGSKSFSNDQTKLDSITRILRLKLIIDMYNYDDILIAFNAGATPLYDFNEDSKYFPGINSPEGLASYSSDGVALSQNFLPLPKQSADVIRLDIEAQRSGAFTLKRTQLDSIPKNYQVQLIDKYKKDTVDLRVDSAYAFDINKADTASFGSYRFEVVVSLAQPQTPPFKMVDIKGEKEPGAAQITWTTENEGNNTLFTLERSNDGGTTFNVLDTLTSSSVGAYSFLDKTPPAGTDEYRLKATDIKGAISYSDIVTLVFSDDSGDKTTTSIAAAPGKISIYPNPASNIINLTIDQTTSDKSPALYASQTVKFSTSLAASVATNASSYTIKIININGFVVQTSASSSAAWQGNVGKLSPGTYVIQVINNSNNNIAGRSTFIKL